MKGRKMRILETVLVLSGMALSLALPGNMIHRAQAEITDSIVGEKPQNVPTIKQVSEGINKSSVEFESNQGQFDKQVRYRARAADSTIYLTSNEAVYVLPISNPTVSATDESRADDESKLPSRAFALRMKFVGANPDSRHTGEAVREHRTNYFIGNNPENWQTDVPNFGRVRYENVYNGVDMLWHGLEQGATRYDFIVAPNADYRQINLQFDGADSLEIDGDGSLLIKTAAGVIKQNKPVTFQETDGARTEIESNFTVAGNSAQFEVGEYDRLQPLTIDPTVNLSNLAYSTFLGAEGSDFGEAVEVDSLGNAYVVGSTTSDFFPTTAGAFDTNPFGTGSNDAFVTKFNAGGSALIYSTYIGGVNADSGNDITLDAAGNVYVTGSTSSPDFPTTTSAYDGTWNGFTDVFVAKLNQAGTSLSYSTFIGGSALDVGNGIDTDSAGNIYVTGNSADGTTDYPTTTGAFDVVHNGNDDVIFSKINPAGGGASDLVYSTFLGGSAKDDGNAIAVDDTNRAFITGGTFSTNFPIAGVAFDPSHNGGEDVFVCRVNPIGGGASDVFFSTFLGGSGSDSSKDIAVDQFESAYIVGESNSTDYPTVNNSFDTSYNGQTDVILSKLNVSGTNLQYSTYLGGSLTDRGKSIALDSAGVVYLTGETFPGATTPFPTTPGASDTTGGSQTDAFMTKIKAVPDEFGELPYSTYISSVHIESGEGIAVDSSGNVFVTGTLYKNTTANVNFQTTPGAFQTTWQNGRDAFVRKFGDYSISGRVLDATTNAPVSNVNVAMSGQSSANMLTGADGRFNFGDTANGQPHSVSAMRSGYSINPALFNIANLNGNRELLFLAQVGSPTGGSGGTLRFADLSYTKGENGSSVTATISRMGQITTAEPVTVDFQTVNGTALADADYAAQSGILVFDNPFDNTKTITIPLLDDGQLEPRENFNIVLSNPTNNAEIETNRGSTTVQILDEDLSNGKLLISEFRQRGRLGANDEYVKLFNPNDFDITAFAPDGSNGLTVAKSMGADVSAIVTIPNLVTIPARGHYLLTNNNPSGGFSLIDYPTGRGSTTAVGDQTFSTDIADNSNLVILKTANHENFNQTNLVDAVGFNAGWTGEGSLLPATVAENSESCYVRKLTANNLQDTNNNNADFMLLDNHARVFSSGGGKLYSALGAPAPETTESLRLMNPSEVAFSEYVAAFGSERYDSTAVPNGYKGTLTLYRQITNNTGEPLNRLRLRVIEFPTEGSASQRRYSSRPDFRILSSDDETIGEFQSELTLARGVTLAAERLQPNGGGINSTLTVDSITPQTPLAAGQTVVVAIRLGVMRYGRHPFTVAIEAMK